MLFVSPAALNFSSLKHSHSWWLHNKDVLQSTVCCLLFPRPTASREKNIQLGDQLIRYLLISLDRNIPDSNQRGSVL